MKSAYVLAVRTPSLFLDKPFARRAHGKEPTLRREGSYSQ